jgi:hypothetical protein
VIVANNSALQEFAAESKPVQPITRDLTVAYISLSESGYCRHNTRTVRSQAFRCFRRTFLGVDVHSALKSLLIYAFLRMSQQSKVSTCSEIRGLRPHAADGAGAVVSAAADAEALARAINTAAGLFIRYAREARTFSNHLRD